MELLSLSRFNSYFCSEESDVAHLYIFLLKFISFNECHEQRDEIIVGKNTSLLCLQVFRKYDIRELRVEKIEDASTMTM